MLEKIRNNRGFTMIELLMVFIVLGILAQISLVFLMDLRSRSFDTMAISDGRNFMTTVRANFANLEDVDYTEVDGSDIGVQTTGGGTRPPVFTLSPGVNIRFEPGNHSSTGTPEEGYFEASLFHTNGTAASTDSGRREYYYMASEAASTYIIATF